MLNHFHLQAGSLLRRTGGARRQYACRRHVICVDALFCLAQRVLNQLAGNIIDAATNASQATAAAADATTAAARSLGAPDSAAQAAAAGYTAAVSALAANIATTAAGRKS